MEYKPFAWCTEAKVTVLEQYTLPMLRLPKRGTVVEFATGPTVKDRHTCLDKLFTPPEFEFTLVQKCPLHLGQSFATVFKEEEQKLVNTVFPNVPLSELHISHRGAWEMMPTIEGTEDAFTCVLSVSIARILDSEVTKWH